MSTISRSWELSKLDQKSCALSNTSGILKKREKWHSKRNLVPEGGRFKEKSKNAMFRTDICMYTLALKTPSLELKTTAIVS